ncbi:MAG TPA: hypothetical protein VEV41_23850 [Terriglobales bacterium]|nr:hypothetical protein [Terriglobales bacterium]
MHATFLLRHRHLSRSRILPYTAVLLVIASAGLHSLARQTQQNNDEPSAGPFFTDEDGVGLLSNLRQAIENNRQDRLLKMFDAAKVPNYEEFREQVADFFQKYEAFQVRYHLTQTSTEGDKGVLLADFAIEATPAGGGAPSVRKDVALRLVVAKNDKGWKIVDLSPRELFSTQ